MDHNQPIQLSAPSKFIWRIEKFSSLSNKNSHSSRVFTVGKTKWYIMINPKVKDRTHLSVYLKPCNIIGNQLPYAEYSVSILNQKNHTQTLTGAGKGLTSSAGYCWSNYYSLADLHNPVKGFIVKDTCVIKVEISACMVATSQPKPQAKVSSKADKDNKTSIKEHKHDDGPVIRRRSCFLPCF